MNLALFGAQKRGGVMAVSICVLDLLSVSTEKNCIESFGEAEEKRIEAIKNPTRRQESVAGLTALKKALGNRAFCSIVRDQNGRPRFEKDMGIDFNISHSGSLAVAAVCDGNDTCIGVDIELVKTEKLQPLLRVAERYFEDTEKEKFYKTHDVLNFYKAWTAKEAKAKLLGVGLAKSLGEKKEPPRAFFTSHYLVLHSGERYVLCLCSAVDGREDIDFITEHDTSVSPL